MIVALFHQCDEECIEFSDKDHPIPGRWTIDGRKFSRCPKVGIDINVYAWTRAYSLYKNSVLPNSGGWLDQAEKFISIMLFIDAKVESHKREANGKK